MKILFSITYYAPYISGLTIYAQRLAEALTKRGYKVTVLTSRYDKLLPKREIINEEEVKRSPVLFRIGKGLIMPLLPLEALLLSRNADVINCHLPQPEAFWLLLFGRILGKRTVITYHCDVKLPSGLGNFLLEKALLVGNFLNCFLADVIVNSSQDYALNSPVLLFFKNKLKIIYPPIPAFSGFGQDQNFKKRILAYRRKYKVGFVGRLAADKGIEYLLLSVPYLKARVKNFGIFLVGPEEPVGEEKYKGRIEQLVKKFPENVFLLGKLSESELKAFFQTIDALVLPSINSTEAFGMVQIEAMRNGVPVVASDLPGVRVPVKLTGMGKIVSPKDPVGLATAIGEILVGKKNFVKSEKEINQVFPLAKPINDYEALFAH